MRSLDAAGPVGVAKSVFRGGGACLDPVFGADMDGRSGVLIGGLE